MPTDQILTTRVRHNWLIHGPLKNIASPYIERLRSQRYADRTISIYLGCLAHFGFWLNAEELELANVNSSLVTRYLREHVPACTGPVPCGDTIASAGAALRHLLRLLPSSSLAMEQDPVTIELVRFDQYLKDICGLTPNTRESRAQHVGAFLSHVWGAYSLSIARLSATDVDAYVASLHTRLKPSSQRIVCNSLRSYFRYRAVMGDQTTGLAAALPRIADWRRSTLPKVLSNAELAAFLDAFDLTDPVGLRDYAIARCLLDLGLRGHEVTYLTLESIDWRRAMLTISDTKSKRVQQLPLPESTGAAVAQYLRQGRPQTLNRRLFVRHRAPLDKPLSVAAIRNSMNRAFARCGLSDQFCNTHVLRRTMATQLQCAGISVKEIADVLRHKSLDTAYSYARVDVAQLRTIAQPWPGSPS